MTRSSAALRLAAYYFALFATVGIHLPFWPLWLKAQGLDAAQIGMIIASTYLVKVLVNPLIGHWADHGGQRRRMMIVMAGCATLCWMIFAIADGFAAILILTILATGFWAGLMPIGESLALMTTKQHDIVYGRVRLWGSIAFILAATLVGRLLLDYPPSVLVWLVCSGLAVTFAACLAMPDPHPPQRHDGPLPLGPLLKSAGFLLFLAVTSLNQAAHTVYYAFATIHWKAAGHSDSIIGLLWSEGVIAEIILFMISGPIIHRLGPQRLLLLAALGGILRWGVLGSTTWLPALIGVQCLHAATFGCAHLGAMTYIQKFIPGGLSTRAQSIFAAVSIGLAPGLMSPLTGQLYQGLGGAAFYLMAALSLFSAFFAWGLIRIRQHE